jgi:glucokinase
VNILSVDIGGTHTRFGGYFVSNGILESVTDEFIVLTRDERIESFDDLITLFSRTRPSGFYALTDYKRIVLAVAGPVIGDRCILSNIDWEVNLATFQQGARTLLLNDFIAQSYGLVQPIVKSRLLKIYESEKSDYRGNIAVIGAGTGLGLCCLVPKGEDCLGEFSAIASEAGHSTFSFIGDAERKLEEFILERINTDYCANENVVSGRGLSLIHEYLTGDTVAPKTINKNDRAFRNTINLFSSLYGRACRNYCLATFTTQSLLITGGVAAHLPSVVTNPEFYREFVNCESHKSILKSINVYLNPGIEAGLLGAAYYGMCSPRIA